MKPRSLYIFGAVATLLTVAASRAAEAEAESVALAIVYDTSGSMRDPVRLQAGGSSPKHVIAERALANVVERLRMFIATGHPLSFGVYTFSHNTAHVLSPFAPFNSAGGAALLKRLPEPGGGTPLGDTVQRAADDVLRSKATRKHVLVITDGINTVGPDPSAVLPKIAARAAQQATTVSFHFVAFDVDANRFAAVKKHGATVVGAADEAQLGEQLTLILEKKILLEEEVPPAPKPKTN